MIGKLRDQYGVNIVVPKPGDDADSSQANLIKLIGYEQKCEKVKEALLAIVKEQVSVHISPFTFLFFYS